MADSCALYINKLFCSIDQSGVSYICFDIRKVGNWEKIYITVSFKKKLLRAQLDLVWKTWKKMIYVPSVWELSIFHNFIDYRPVRYTSIVIGLWQKDPTSISGASQRSSL